ncbi:hypothetical protein AHAS_Ahas15G0142100 [Arachis hypogaea]
MAVSFLQERKVSDLCLGKPPLRSLSASSNIAHALATLNNSEDNFISVWIGLAIIAARRKKKEESAVDALAKCAWLMLFASFPGKTTSCLPLKLSKLLFLLFSLNCSLCFCWKC